jgi:hypothetical protein
VSILDLITARISSFFMAVEPAHHSQTAEAFDDLDRIEPLKRELKQSSMPQMALSATWNPLWRKVKAWGRSRYAG